MAHKALSRRIYSRQKAHRLKCQAAVRVRPVTRLLTNWLRAPTIQRLFLVRLKRSLSRSMHRKRSGHRRAAAEPVMRIRVLSMMVEFLRLGASQEALSVAD